MDSSVSSLSEYCRSVITQYPVPRVFDQLAKHFPTHIHVAIPLVSNNGSDDSLHYEDISYSRLSLAVNAAAAWLDEQLALNVAGREEEKLFINRPPSHTIHYIGPQDLRCLIYILAAAKIGCRLLLCHPAIVAQDYLSLMNQSSCDVVIVTNPATDKAMEVVAASPNIKKLVSPELQDLLAASPDKTHSYAYPYTLSETGKDTLFIAHSSGTTGSPKILLMDFWYMAQLRLADPVPELDSIDYQYSRLKGQRYVMMIPASIMAGQLWNLGLAFLFETTLVLPPADRPFSAATFRDTILASKATCALASPRIFEEAASSEQNLAAISQLTHGLFYIGAPCPPAAGKVLSKHTRLMMFYGSTEVNLLPILPHPSPAEYDWISFSSSLPHRFDHVYDNQYTLILERDSPDKSDLGYQAVFRRFPEITDYPMKDIFEKHPSQPGFWRYMGRMEDLMEAEDGSAFLPTSMEHLLNGHPAVWAAMVCAERSGGLALALIPKPNSVGTGEGKLDRSVFIDQLWPDIERANKLCPIKAKIHKELVLVPTQDVKQFPLGTKGFLQRNNFRQLIAPQINTAFSNWLANRNIEEPYTKTDSITKVDILVS